MAPQLDGDDNDSIEEIDESEDTRPHDFVPRRGTAGVGSVAMSSHAAATATAAANNERARAAAQGMDERISRQQQQRQGRPPAHQTPPPAAAAAAAAARPGAYQERNDSRVRNKTAGAAPPSNVGATAATQLDDRIQRKNGQPSPAIRTPKYTSSIPVRDDANPNPADDEKQALQSEALPGVVHMEQNPPSWGKKFAGVFSSNSEANVKGSSFFGASSRKGKKGESVKELYDAYLSADVQLANPDLFEEERTLWDEMDKTGLCVGLVIMIVLTVAITVPVQMKKQALMKEYQEMNRPIDNTWRYEPIATRLGDIWGDLIFADPESVQSQALDWIVFQDPRLVPPQAETLVQRYILAVLFLSCNGPKWINRAHWMSHKDECDWDRVHCDENDQVTSLELHSNLLSGSIPAELGWLSQMETMNLHNNDLVGEIPIELYQLSGLRYLSLDRNRLEGTLNANIGNLVNLETIDVSQNNFFGLLPDTLADLQELNHLVLYTNRFKGPIFDKVTNLFNLQTLDLAENKFTGTIPTEVAQLTRLQEIELKSNLFTGQIPVEITQLESLVHLRMSFNDFEGPIPPDIGDMESLEFFNMEENRRIGGTIPAKIGNLHKLKMLDMGACGLTGQIPPSFGNLTNVAHLNLFSNYLTGDIPQEMANMTNLRVALLHYNDLEGTVPEGLCHLRDRKLVQLEADCKREVICDAACCTRCTD